MKENTKWRGMMARDARGDGAFVYAVRSTGIYCRPSCPSRRPRRAQVVFFGLPEAAERAGYRPCRRCRPEESNHVTPQAQKVRRVCEYIEAKREGTPTLAELAAHVGASPFHLARTFQRLLGVTPRQYADARKLERLRGHLKEERNVTHALYEAGYGSSRGVYERAPGSLGMTPRTYRTGGRGTAIGYTVVPSPLGRLLVAATARGICRVMLGEGAQELETLLRKEFPGAEIQRDDRMLRRWVESILGHLEGSQPHLDLPMDIRATAFERRVWELLRSIPYGRTRSYGELARGLGKPGAARAVGRACAANPVALLIPCHRVVREDGSPGGYRWGTARKAALLESEKARRRLGKRSVVPPPQGPRRLAPSRRVAV